MPQSSPSPFCPPRLGHELRAALASRSNAVLATVVRTEGSTYRKPGASMLVLPGGQTIGLLSGGCLEDLIAAAALEVAAARTCRLLHFDLTADNEYLIGYGKGCFGRIWILLEPLANGRGEKSMALLNSIFDERRPRTVALIYEVTGTARAAAGQRLALEKDGSLLSDLEPAAMELELRVAALLRSTPPSQRGKVFDLEVENGRVSLCLHEMRPSVDLMIFGCGPDAQPLAAIARQLGWTVRLFDHRPAHARPDKFPTADNVLHYDPSNVGAFAVAEPHSAVVVMTHNLMVDAEVLRWASSEVDIRYVGLLGPSHRTKKIFDLYADDRQDLTTALAGRLHAPIGLDLGGGSEAAIALAIAAEVQMRCHGASGLAKSKATEKKIYAVLPAAGCSSRLGTNKQLVRHEGEAVIRSAVRRALTLGLTGVTVVTGYQAKEVGEATAGLPCGLEHNQAWSTGLGSSIAAGVRAAESDGADGVLILLPDQIDISVAHLERLLDRSADGNVSIVATSHGETVGVPAFFSRKHFADLQALPPEAGARRLIERHKDEVAVVFCAEAAHDLDTPEELKALMARAVNHSPRASALHQ